MSSTSMKRQSPSLRSLALKVTTKSILDFFLSDKYTCEEAFNEYQHVLQTSLPLSLKEEITMELIPIILKFRKDSSLQMLKFFLSNVTPNRNLIIYVDQFNLFNITTLIRPFAKNFINLTVFFSKLSFEEIILFFNLNYENLQILQINIDCDFDFEILGAILNSCPELKELDIRISGNNNLFIYQTGDEVYLPKHLNLRRFDYVEVPNKCEMQTSILNIFAIKFPNLKFLKFPIYLTDSFLMLQSLNLMELILYETSLSKFKLLTDSSPNLVSLELVQPQRGVISCLSKLKKLKILNLTCCEISEIYDFVKISGPQILSLTLYSCEIVDMNNILNSCPNLKSFHLRENVNVIAQNQIKYYDHIKEFTFVGQQEENLKYLLQGFRNVENLKIECDSYPLVENIIDTNLFPSWQNLTNFTLNTEELLDNEEFFKSLVQSCPKLQRLECLGSFDFQLNVIKALLTATNCNTRIVLDTDDIPFLFN